MARVPAATLVAVLLALALGGCVPAIFGGGANQPSHSQQDGGTAQDRALDQMVAAAQGQIPSIMNNSNGTYSEITITAVHPDTISYTYVYATQLDASKANAYFATQVSAIQKVCDDAVFPAMKAAGITSAQHAVYTYLNADRSPIWTRTFSPSD